LQARRRGGSSGAPLAKSTLAPPLAKVLDVLDLYDPTTMSSEDQDNVIGAVVAGFAVFFPLLYAQFGLFPDFLLATAFGGGVSGYCALRKDIIGSITRDIAGSSTNLVLVNVVEKAEAIAEEYELTRGSQARLQRQVEQLTRLRGKLGPAGEATEGQADDLTNLTRDQLYEELDWRLDREDYPGAARVKARLDEL